MSGRVLPDTHIVIALFAGEATVLTALNEVRSASVPVITLGELYFGAQKSGRPTLNAQRVFEFSQAIDVLGCDASTARIYGELKNTLRAQGHPIPANDVWIEGIALQNEMELVTRDAYFSFVPNLKITKW